jgi:hypothetical protein
MLYYKRKRFSFSTTATGKYLVCFYVLVKQQLMLLIFKKKSTRNKQYTDAEFHGTETGIKQEWRLKTLDIVHGGISRKYHCCYKLYRNTSVGEDGRLFVRGGEANETQTFVDGIRCSPYNATIGNVPTRGRFSPFCSAELLFQQEVIQLNMASFQCFT